MLGRGFKLKSLVNRGGNGYVEGGEREALTVAIDYLSGMIHLHDMIEKMARRRALL